MLQRSMKTLTILMLAAINAQAELVPIYDNWLNSSFMSSKNSITAGATTATAKGYNAILSNPAGLSTNSNITLYTKTVAVQRTDNDENIITEYNDLAANLSVGAMYDSIGVEMKLNDYVVLGGAYGYESDYGLFSLGASYLLDQTDLSDTTSDIGNKEFATGNYSTVGFMWQKSFISEDSFYAVYLGVSSKSYGTYDGENKEGTTLQYSSPKRTSYGVGLETNIMQTSLLLTFDMFEEEGQELMLNGDSYGLKWLLSEKVAIGAGMSNQTFSSGELTDIQQVGAGVELGLLKVQTNISWSQRLINAKSEQNNLKEDAIHVDLAFVF